MAVSAALLVGATPGLATASHPPHAVRAWPLCVPCPPPQRASSRSCPASPPAPAHTPAWSCSSAAAPAQAARALLAPDTSSDGQCSTPPAFSTVASYGQMYLGAIAEGLSCSECGFRLVGCPSMVDVEVVCPRPSWLARACMQWDRVCSLLAMPRVADAHPSS